MKPVKNNKTKKQKPVVKRAHVAAPKTQHPIPNTHYSLPNTFQVFCRSNYFFPVIIGLLCLMLYGNTFNSDYTEDDGIYTKENVYVKHGFSDVKNLFTKGSLYGSNMGNGSSYRPLVLLTFMAETSWFSLNPHVYQRFNVLYFALTCLFFFFFVQKVFQKYNAIVPIAATLLFIFHPIHTDCVANFKSRDEILTLMFGLLSFWQLLMYNEKGKLSNYLISITAFACSLLCKETSVTYFVIIPLVLYFFTSSNLKSIVIKTLPFAGVLLVYLFLRYKIFDTVTSHDEISIINNSLMAAKTQMDYYATDFVMLGKYLLLLFVPYPLSWDYSYPQFPIVSWGNIWAITSLLAYIGLGVLIITGFKKKSIYSFSAIFYLVTLFLTSNLVLKIACSFGERFLFSPSLGFCLAMPVLLSKGLKPKAFKGVMIAVLVIYAFILIPRNADWKNDYTLFKSGVISAPNSGRTHGALASMYMDTATKAKDPAKMNQFYALAAQEFKRVTELFTMDPDGYYNLGVCYYGEGKQDSAIPAYKKSLELKPSYSLAANNLGVIYFNKGQYDLAIPYFITSSKSDSNNLDALMNIGASYQNEKNYAQAFHYDSLVLKKAPGNRATLMNLSILHNDIGMNYVSNNELDKAQAEFSAALQCDTNSTNAIGNMGVVYQKKGNIEKARECYKRALLKDPKNEVFARNLQNCK